MVYGDYDVDGTTSVALVYGLLAHYSERIIHYVPDRYAEGYGIENVAYVTHQTLGNDYMPPDARVILDFDDNAEEERKRRIQQRGMLETPDTFEMRGDDFQQRVRDGYRLIARRDNIPLISSQQEKEVVAREVWAQVMGQVGLSLVFDRFDGTR